jgi:hypothetical protein
MWTRDGRNIIIDDEMTIQVRYTEPGSAFKGMRLDHEVMPLVAAAPEMLKALKTILQHYQDARLCLVNRETDTPVMAAVRAVIAKAEGKGNSTKGDNMEKPHTLTFRQFADQSRAEYLAENPELTRAEYDRAEMDGFRIGEWRDIVEDAASRGELIPARVLDDLSKRLPDYFRLLLKFHGSNSGHCCIPEGYLPPEIRRMNQEHEKEMRDARKVRKVRAIA